MKKKLFFLAVAAVALASCSNDQVVSENTTTNQPKEIAFMPIAQPSTRAASATTTAIEGSTYPDELTMQVSAYSVPSSSDQGTAGNYFEMTAFDGTNATNWKGGRYWPLADTYISFLAVAGVESGDISMTSPYASTSTIKYDDASFTAQTDLMYAANQAHVTKAGNVITYPGAVAMQFKHALSWLQFKVRVPSGAGYGAAIAITGITIKGANKNGTYTITNSNYDDANTAQDPSGVWGESPTAFASTNYAVPSATKASLSNSAFEDCGAALIVPKPAAASFTSFVIDYTINGAAFKFEYTPASTILAQATKYVYNITFTLTEIEIDPEVVPWTNYTEYVDVPQVMAYGSNYTVAASKDAQTLKFNLTGFTAASGNKYKVTVGGTNNTQVTATTPTTTASDLPGTSASVTATINASGGAAKEFTLTIQETQSDGSTAVGSPTVITVNQAAS